MLNEEQNQNCNNEVKDSIAELLVKRLSSIDIVLKVSERCNLTCPYCYYYFQEFDGNSKSAVINKDVILLIKNLGLLLVIFRHLAIVYLFASNFLS